MIPRHLAGDRGRAGIERIGGGGIVLLVGGQHARNGDRSGVDGLRARVIGDGIVGGVEAAPVAAPGVMAQLPAFQLPEPLAVALVESVTLPTVSLFCSPDAVKPVAPLSVVPSA